MSNPMMQAMQQLQLMQQKMAEAQQQLSSMTVTETGGGGMVKATANGHGVLTKLEISPEALSNDADMFEDLLMTTVNRVLESARTMAQNHVGAATEGLMPDIPGLDIPM